MWAFLLGLVQSISAWLSGRQSSVAERAGKAEQQSDDLKAAVNVLHDEAKAAANAPTTMEQLIAAQREGRE